MVGIFIEITYSFTNWYLYLFFYLNILFDTDNKLFIRPINECYL